MGDGNGECKHMNRAVQYRAKWLLDCIWQSCPVLALELELEGLGMRGAKHEPLPRTEKENQSQTTQLNMADGLLEKKIRGTNHSRGATPTLIKIAIHAGRSSRGASRINSSNS